MIQINQLNISLQHSLEDVKRKAAKLVGCRSEQLQEFEILKKSIDARKKPEIYISYSVRFKINNEEAFLRKNRDGRIQRCEEKIYSFPEPGEKKLTQRPVIIGMGPAGLFCAYYLAMHGYKPLLLERGKDVDSRRNDVEAFWKGDRLLPDSNVQFGEGGAGTFSDGKLNTLIKDRDGRNREILKTFVECGAPKEILYDSKPHIGTDVLAGVVKTMREKLIAWGGEVRFESRVVELLMEQKTETNILNGLVIEKTNGEKSVREVIPASLAVLAIGHSARDTFEMLFEKEIPMEAKAFAVGFRVQHPQRMINYDQYGQEEPGLLTAAPYKVTARTKYGRSVYSFCMCPGGFVVNASSEEGRVAVNGMSYSDRGGINANSAIIVSVTPMDYGTDHPLSGIQFQRDLEERAYRAGNGKIPSQYYGDFRAMVEGTKAEPFEKNVQPAMCGETQFGDMTGILPGELNRSFVDGMEQFGKVLPGFNRPDAILSGVESRTSSPVRILRDESLQSQKVAGLYPCGEGAGYAGGITSAAMDGLRVAEKIAALYKPLDESL